MTVSAGLGIANFPATNVPSFWRWVRQCEEGGIDSIWQNDRIISSEPQLECMSVMAALAGATQKIKFGMNVASLGIRDPVITAKACATIDLLSEGRLLPAFGVGSALSQDYSARGIPTKGRGQRTSEGLNIITKLWTEDNVSFNGKYYQLRDASIAPKPVQQPLPLWVGGSSPQAIERTALWGTGWQAGIESPEEVAPVVIAIKKRSTELKRKIDNDHYGAGFAFRFGSPNEVVYKKYLSSLEKRLRKKTEGLMVAGDADDIMDLLLKFRSVGIHKFVLRPIAKDGPDLIKQTSAFIKYIVPKIERLKNV